MKELISLALTLSLFIGLAIPISDVSAQNTNYHISGYVMDSKGQGIMGAMIIFSAQSNIPPVLTVNGGYYNVTIPPGTYRLGIYPPYDSNYMSYSENGILVSSNLIKNVTLNSGYKVSGYLTLFGKPVMGATIRLDSYNCGWYSNYTGHYFVTAPPGTYTLTISSGSTSSATNFVTYQEYNFALTGNTIRNIAITNITTIPPSTAPTPTTTAKPTNMPTSPTPNPTPTATPNNVGKFKISGYLLDSTGHALNRAMVLLNVPDIVPSVYTNAAGYYELYAPAGTYHMNVWPPFDTNYLYYDQPGFVVSSNIVKNITLVSGYKISGYVVDLSGKPATGAVVSLGFYYSGWYTTSSGYYFVGVPAGDYTMNAHPRTGNFQSPTTSFPNYYEYNVAVNGNMIKNLTVGNPTVTPTPRASTGLPSTGSNSTQSFKLSGYILDPDRQPIVGAKVHISGLSSSKAAFTDSRGYYELYHTAGTYTVFVFPPFDSNYIMLKENSFSLLANSLKNLTLVSGNKVSGIIYDPSGKPFEGGAAILFGNLTSGWMSNSSGYYSLSLPNGTYNIQIHPSLASNLPNYFESNFQVNSTTIKNIVLSTQKTASSTDVSASIVDILAYQEEITSLTANLSYENADQKPPSPTTLTVLFPAAVIAAVGLLFGAFVVRRKYRK